VVVYLQAFRRPQWVVVPGTLAQKELAEMVLVGVVTMVAELVTAHVLRFEIFELVEEQVEDRVLKKLCYQYFEG
jgi:hypothetical protein